jgi:hypothetical protein
MSESKAGNCKAVSKDALGASIWRKLKAALSRQLLGRAMLDAVLESWA